MDLSSEEKARSIGAQLQNPIALPTPKPFLRWVGSKHKLIPQILPAIPDVYNRYFEPFLGAGALYFHLRPQQAFLSDASLELVQTWKSVRDDVDSLVDYLSPLRPDKEVFYGIRSNRSESYPERAAELLYLNKTCWNGLYRVNAKGQFNVPYGWPKTDYIFDEPNLRACSAQLQSGTVSIGCLDFEEPLQHAREGDLVFLDPPYVTKHNMNGFRDYNEKLFSWTDQERLASEARRLKRLGAHVLVSNADHPDVANLYHDFQRISLERSSTLASNSLKRGRTTEALFF